MTGQPPRDDSRFAQAIAGQLITFSGTDGSGKTTLHTRLCDSIRERGGQPFSLWARSGHTPALEFLKGMTKRVRRAVKRTPRITPTPRPSAANPASDDFSTGNRWVNYGYIHLSLAELMWIYGVYLRLQTWRGKTVVCDRYLPDMLVDITARFGLDGVERWLMWRLLTCVAPRPTIAFLLLTPVEVSIQRLDASNDPLDARPIHLEQRLAHYEALARTGDWQVLDTTRSLDDLSQEIITRVEAALLKA